MTVVEPRVVSEQVARDTATLELVVPAELAYFDGHFPGFPVVPGVVQIGWALAAARRCLGASGSVRRMEAVKFQSVIGADAAVTLSLEYAADTGKLHFSFASSSERFSSGRLVLGAADGTASVRGAAGAQGAASTSC